MKPETASRIRGRIEVILDAAKTQGLRTDENPARWKGHLANLLPSKRKVRRVRHHPALPYAQLPAFLRELRGRPSLSARALEFCILTAARSTEETPSPGTPPLKPLHRYKLTDATAFAILKTLHPNPL